jgi:hypothetical protein
VQDAVRLAEAEGAKHDCLGLVGATGHPPSSVDPGQVGNLYARLRV